MSTITLTNEQSNNVAFLMDLEYAVLLLQRLREDADALHGKMRDIHSRYADGVPQDFCDDVGQLAEDMLDKLRDVDPAYLVEVERREAADLHQRYLDKMVLGREYHDFC